jgi:hypothetical protein
VTGELRRAHDASQEARECFGSSADWRLVKVTFFSGRRQRRYKALAKAQGQYAPEQIEVRFKSTHYQVDPFV